MKYIDLITSEGPKTLLTLPKNLIERLVQYLNLEDIAQLFYVSRVGNEVLKIILISKLLLLLFFLYTKNHKLKFIKKLV